MKTCPVCSNLIDDGVGICPFCDTKQIVYGNNAATYSEAGAEIPGGWNSGNVANNGAGANTEKAAKKHLNRSIINKKNIKLATIIVIGLLAIYFMFKFFTFAINGGRGATSQLKAVKRFEKAIETKDAQGVIKAIYPKSFEKEINKNGTGSYESLLDYEKDIMENDTADYQMSRNYKITKYRELTKAEEFDFFSDYNIGEKNIKKIQKSYLINVNYECLLFGDNRWHDIDMLFVVYKYRFRWYVMVY